MAGSNELVEALRKRAESEQDPMLLAAAERLLGAEQLLLTVNRYGHTAMWQRAVKKWIGAAPGRESAMPTTSASGIDPSTLPAWDCPACGQKNAGWTTTCGRCGAP